LGSRSSDPLRLGILASGGGTNLQAILDRIAGGALSARVEVVISNNSKAGALDRSRAAGIPALHLSGHRYPDPDELDLAMLEVFRRHHVEAVALAGYMKQLGRRVLGAFRNSVYNIHPALLPSFGGKGMYGNRVHQAVLEAGAKVTGVTVHLVDEEYDRGPIVAQRAVSVEEGDTPETLSARVLRVEHALYPEVLQWAAEGRIRVEGRRAHITPV
jgi:phosphoribosylglycinamide formyltransferase-1